uniref:Uncharacterized protein n=1 Tax=Mus musculus TaxID=10090 RepID=Q8CB33_MOUSE|nr:unnamed protein product [Mus musculus]
MPPQRSPVAQDLCDLSGRGHTGNPKENRVLSCSPSSENPECQLDKVFSSQSALYSGLPASLLMVHSFPADCLQKQECQSAFYKGMHKYINETMLFIALGLLCKELQLSCSVRRLCYDLSGLNFAIYLYIL